MGGGLGDLVAQQSLPRELKRTLASSGLKQGSQFENPTVVFLVVLFLIGLYAQAAFVSNTKGSSKLEFRL